MWCARLTGAVGVAVLVVVPAVQAQVPTETEVTMDRVEGPLRDLEVFGEDGPYHVWLQDVIVTVRTVEGRPLSDQEKDESRAIAVTCPNGSPYDVVDGEAGDGAYVISFTCE